MKMESMEIKSIVIMRIITMRIVLVFIVIVFVCQGCTDDGNSSVGISATTSDLNSSSDHFFQDDPLIRKTTSGLVQGVSQDQNYVWLGIPYGKPPVGELRWRAPQDPDNWQGIRVTHEFCSACTQYGGIMGYADPSTFGKLMGDENCLYVNIWRPKTDAEGLPVLVWIPGGGGFAGSADLTMYHGANFSVRQNVIFVSLNYRVGPMGWFTHPALRTGNPLDSSGNYGTLDIIKALQWVHENIAAFGGDPQNVTIDGQSFGGISVFSMLVSPLSAGLFQQAIIQSGVPTAGTLSSGDKIADKVLGKLLVKDGLIATTDDSETFLAQKDDTWIADYLRSKSTADIYGCFTHYFFGMMPEATAMTFKDGVVIPGNPLTMISKGNYHKVPIIIGHNHDEVKTFMALIFSKYNTDMGASAEIGFVDLMRSFDPDHDTLKISKFMNPLPAALYGPFCDTIDSLASIYFDYIFTTMAKQQDNLYVYTFKWHDEPASINFILGSGHAVEIPIVFGNFGQTEENIFRFAWSSANKSDRERLSTNLMNYWGNFARTGNPNSSGAYAWLPWSNTSSGFKRIIFDTEITSSPKVSNAPASLSIPSVSDTTLNAQIKWSMDLLRIATGVSVDGLTDLITDEYP